MKNGKVLTEKAIVLLKRNHDTDHLGDAYKESSNYYDYSINSELEQKTKAVELAVSYFEKKGPSLKLASNLSFLADLYMNQSKIDQGLATIERALILYKKFHYPKLQQVYIMYSRLNSSRSNYKEAFKYGLMALKTAEAMHDSTMERCLIYNVNGKILIKTKEYSKAIGFYKNSLKVAQRYQDKNAIILSVGNIMYGYIMLGKYNTALQFLKSIPKKEFETTNEVLAIYPSALYCQTYTYLKQYKLAKPYADLLIKNISKQADVFSTILVKYFTATKQYDLAKTYIKKGTDEVYLRKIELPANLLKYYQLTYKLDSTMGYYKLAFNSLVRFNKLKDSISEENNATQFKRLDIEYETEKKESEIKILNQKAQIQRTLLQKADLIRNITGGGIVLILIFTGMLYRQYRIKQKGNIIVQESNIRINEKNKLLEHLLKEKEWLLKEVHHRVKNNLHTVICLLESQALYLENDALKAVENSQHPIYAMSLIHQKLYQSEDIKTINMGLYLPEFVSYLADSFGISSQIRIQLDIEPLQLGVSQAIPLALIVNEAVTNAIKYAFKEIGNGLITISLSQRRNIITLIIADNGVGINAELIKSSSGSLGLNLIKGLTEDINGIIIIENIHGTRFTIEFNPDPLSQMNYDLESVLQQ